MSEEIERTLCQLPQVHVFKIPVRKSADGHRASDWPKDPTWTGKVKIVAKGRVAAIILLDDKNQVFAVCQVTDDSAVERTLDSGRYYVLRITNAQGRHAYIGIAFNERNDAFDFNVALAEFKSELEREDQASKLADLPTGPMKDMSLKEGEKIKIKIGVKKTKQDESGSTPTPAPKAGSGGFLLPPPRGSHGIAGGQSIVNNTPASKRPQDTESWADDNDPFAQSPFNSTTTSSSSSGAHADPFGSFGSSDPFNSSASSSSSLGTDPFDSRSSTGSVTHHGVFMAPSTNSTAATGSRGGEVNLLDL